MQYTCKWQVLFNLHVFLVFFYFRQLYNFHFELFKMENMEKASILKTAIMAANQYIYSKNNSNMILFQHQLDVS